MGWDVGASGLRIVLGVEVPDLVRANVRGDVDAFLGDHGLSRADIGWWVAHPGGPKVLEAMQEALGVEREALGATWRSLDRIGNLPRPRSCTSSPTPSATSRRHPAPIGVLLAMGPGFCLELVLLRVPMSPWHDLLQLCSLRWSPSSASSVSRELVGVETACGVGFFASRR